MKVIHEGKLPEEKVYEAECRYCHTVVEFGEKEANRQSDYRNGLYLMIKCPLCQKPIAVDA